MPKILKPAEEKITRAIRDAIVIDPLISMRSLQSVLEKKGINVGSREYLSRLVWKITRSLETEVDRQVLSGRIAQIKERQRIVIDRLVRIAFYTDDLRKEGFPPPSYRDQIMALNAIVKLDLAILSAEMDAGIFERHIGKIEIEKRYIPLPQELKERMIEALKNYGVIPHEVESKNNETDIPNTTTAIVVAKQQLP